MKTIVFNSIISCGLLCGCAFRPGPNVINSKPALKISADYFASQADTLPLMVAEDIISGRHNERDFAISPDGSEVYYTVVGPKNYFQAIFFIKKENGSWSEPQTASFSGSYADIEPAFSADGKRMYFSSQRPISGKGEPKDWDIWYVDKVGTSWSEAKNLGSPINTSADEFYPSAASDGSIYFTASYDYGVGREDIFKSQLKEGRFEKPQPLGDGVNSTADEFNAFVDPSEQYIIFTSYGRADDMGRGDLYVSFKDKSTGAWLKAIHLPAGINSTAIDYCPFIDARQMNFYFTSERPRKLKYFEKPLTAQEVVAQFDASENGLGNIYRVDAKKITALFKK